MNKVALGFFIAATVGCSASAFAATNGEGQINFTGEIIDSACQVVNGLSNPLNVQLGKVSKTVFTGAGSTSTSTKFDIKLTNCPETVTSAAINFGGTPDADNNAALALTDLINPEILMLLRALISLLFIEKSLCATVIY